MSEGFGVSSGDLRAPSLRRRLAAFAYEGILLFGVLMIAGYLFSSLTQQRHAMVGRHGLQAFLFVVLGVYFTWFWSHGGQTVAMKAWHVRLVDRQGHAVTQPRALARYLLSWLWFAPALIALDASGTRDPGIMFGVVFVGAALYALLSRLHPTRQFLHDVVCGTRLITFHTPPKPRA
ncbi:RDD family protein [Piscinibacter sp.]|jgi:uncharacterized RDD family membrane protein YckC|uniref:RDD family protein n=1 Tax=Piscinibacter sp. TaxID=1903157 RepID=UPI00355AAA22